MAKITGISCKIFGYLLFYFGNGIFVRYVKLYLNLNLHNISEYTNREFNYFLPLPAEYGQPY